jgi:transposase
MWIPPEETDPVLLHAPTRKSVGLWGAVNLRGGQLVTQTEKIFNAETFQNFLRFLIAHRCRGKRMIVILDNARYHHAVLLEPYLARHRSTLELFFLPPYSPDLNPIERVWKLTRRLSTHNRYFETLSDLVQSVLQQMASWGKPNDTLTRLCGIY